MREYQNVGIREVIQEINKKYFLPDIQRPFVWDEEQIYKLFDSLMRRYPIGTFLFWKLSAENLKKLEENIGFRIKFFRLIENNKESSIEESTRNRDEYYLILDGQQRLTALNIALRGTWIARNGGKQELYFNVLSGDEKEAEVQFEFKFLEQGQDIITEDSKLWINIKRIFELESLSSSAISKFIDDLKHKSTEIGNRLSETESILRDKISDLRNILSNENIITYYPEIEADYDRVLEIFIRVNSGGTTLSYSDLLFSKIKLRWADARDKFETLLNNINRGVFNFDTDFILKIVLVLFSMRQEDVKYKIENFNDEEIENIKLNWSKIEDAITLAVNEIVYDYIGIRSNKMLTSENSIIPIIYFIYKFTPPKNNNSINSNMRKWFIYALLTKVFSGQSDTTLYHVKEALDRAASANNFPIRELLNAGQAKRGLDFIKSLKYGGSDSYLILSLLYREVIDLDPAYKGNLPQEDHVFSKRELRGAGFHEEEINDIGNIRFTTAQNNNQKSDMDYADWIKIASDKEKKYLIPETPESWNTKNYINFIEKRKEMLIQNMLNIVGIKENELPLTTEDPKESKTKYEKLDIFVTDIVARHYILVVLSESQKPLTRLEIVKRVYRKLESNLKPADLEHSKWKARWEARVRFGVTGLKLENAIESKSANAWTITSKGRELLDTKYSLSGV